MAGNQSIRTPDQRLRVFVSSTLGELAEERAAVRAGIERLHLVPVMFELGARPHPPRALYRAYVDQSQVFVGIYWQRYGWVAPGETISGIEDEWHRAGSRPRLVYIREPANGREPALTRFLEAIQRDDRTSYKRFGTSAELSELVQHDLAVLLSERFGGDATTEDRTPLPLPRPLTSLVGRDESVETISRSVVAGTRLLTITGPGGVGKSRLAAEVAVVLAERLPDGAGVVALAAIESPHLALAAVADRLGVRLDGGRAPSDAIVDHLGGRDVALVLDNLEHIVGIGPVLVDLLERLPGLRVVATSRMPLHVAGEQVRPLDPLELPPRDAAPTGIATSPAVELFDRRARATDPTFDLAEHADEVAELCRRLDGLPLAIELAAARVRLLPPAVLLDRLGPRLELLTGGPDRPERHRTIAATIDWSVRLLRPTEQAVFARLAVFHGGATLEAVEQICDLEEAGRVTEALESLLDHGLIRLDAATDDGSRVSMLTTVRADAAARLGRGNERDELRRRHLAWYAALADRAQPYLCGPDQVAWLRRVDPERANLRAAVTTGFATGQVATVLEMAWDLYLYYQLRGAYDEPATWVARAAGSPEVLDRRQRGVVTTATAIAELSTGRADLDAQARALADALTTFEETGATFEAAVARMHLGICALASSAWQQADEVIDAAARTFALIGHDWGVGTTRNLQGIALGALGDAPASRIAHERALAAGRRIANEAIVAQALTLLAALALDRDDLDDARRSLAEAVSLVTAAREPIAASGCLEVLAAAALRAGDADAAVHAIDVAASTRTGIGSPLNAVLRGRVGRLRRLAVERGGANRSVEDVEEDVFAVVTRLGALVTATAADPPPATVSQPMVRA